jgi:hypothetical protein
VSLVDIATLGDGLDWGTWYFVVLWTLTWESPPWSQPELVQVELVSSQVAANIFILNQRYVILISQLKYSSVEPETYTNYITKKTTIYLGNGLEP